MKKIEISHFDLLLKVKMLLKDNFNVEFNIDYKNFYNKHHIKIQWFNGPSEISIENFINENIIYENIKPIFLILHRDLSEDLIEFLLPKFEYDINWIRVDFYKEILKNVNISDNYEEIIFNQIEKDIFNNLINSWTNNIKEKTNNNVFIEINKKSILKEEIVSDLKILNYTEKSIVLIGETKPIKKYIIDIGGKWNSNLKDPNTQEKIAGWIFSKSKVDILKTTLNKINLKFDEI